MKDLIFRLFGNEKRQTYLVPLCSILLSLLAGAIVFLMLGKNPLAAYQNLLQGSGFLRKPAYAGSKSMMTDFMSFLNALTPLIFAALSVAAGLKAGLFNIGVSGQMLTAGFVASTLVGYSNLDAPTAKMLVLLIGILVGAACGGLVGWLKYRFRINEVVSTIMINYIAQYVISFFIQTFYINPISRQSNPVSNAARLTLMNVSAGDLKMDLPLGIIVAVLAAIFIGVLFTRTTTGFEMRVVGAGRTAARYAGINVEKNILWAMLISGALAGLAGVSFYLGYNGTIQPGVLPGIGFDGIAVALLGNSNPTGILFASVLVTIISKGTTYMSSISGVEAEIAAVITGLILLCCSCREYFSYKMKQAEYSVRKGGRKKND